MSTACVAQQVQEVMRVGYPPPAGYHFCACTSRCSKHVKNGRAYAYRHSPAYKPKEKATTARGVSYENKANTTSLDYQMAKRRAQVEMPLIEKIIEDTDNKIEDLRQTIVSLQSLKDEHVRRHEHLQALIECADVLTGGPTDPCSSADS